MGILFARPMRGLFAALVLGVASMVIVPAQAFAVTCSGYSCDGKSPETTGCAASAKTLVGPISNYANGGSLSIELRYSTTCHTFWARAWMSKSGWIATDVERSNPYKEYDGTYYGNCPSFCRDNVAANTKVYGYQLYDPGPQTGWMTVRAFWCADSYCYDMLLEADLSTDPRE